MKKILLIEDDRSIRRNIAELLELFDYQVATAENGSKGIETAIVFLPNIILCDVSMKGLDGFQVFDKMKAIPELAAVPFVFLSARVEEADIEKGIAMGAEYQVKPFKSEELLARIERLLKQ